MVLFLALFRPSECLLEVGTRSISARSREAVLPGWPRNRDRLVADGGPKCNDEVIKGQVWSGVRIRPLSAR